MFNEQIEQAKQYTRRWIESVADVVVRIMDSLESPRDVQLTEQDDDSFLLVDEAHSPAPGQRIEIRDKALVGAQDGVETTDLAGATVALRLRPDHFVFREIELPTRATEFLHGVVTAQLDRLTPWSAARAAYGYVRSGSPGPDRVTVTVAACARPLLDVFLTPLRSAAAHSIVVSTIAPDEPSSAPIEVFRQDIRRHERRDRVARTLVNVLGGVLAFACVSIAATSFVSSYIESQTKDATIQSTELRRAIQSGGMAAGSATYLHRLRTTIASPTLVMEMLSRVLPDDTYLTNLEIRGDKLQISGITQDAPSVIKLLEQSETFAQAKFSAPTTRTAGEPGERFQIEARLNPTYRAGP